MKEFLLWLAVMTVLLSICTVFGALLSPPRVDASWAARQRAEFVAHISTARARPAILKSLEFHRILWNNIRIGLLILAGTVTCGLLGLAELAANGLKMGSLYAQAHVSGIPPFQYLRYVIPHAILEYGGYLTAQAAAICYARQAWRATRGEKAQVTWEVLLIAPLSLLLIFAGAWVEVYLTPYL